MHNKQKYQGYIKLGAFNKVKRRRAIKKRKPRTKKKAVKTNVNGSVIFKVALLALFLAVLMKFIFQGVSILDQYKNLSFTDPLGTHLLDPMEINPDNGVVTVTAIIIETPFKEDAEDLIKEPSITKIDHIYLSIWNADLERGILVCIPGWVYYPSLLSGITGDDTYVSFANSLYVANKTEDISYVFGEIETIFGIPINSYIWVDRTAREFTDKVFGEVAYVDDSSEYMQNFVDSIGLFDLLTSSKELEDSLISVEDGEESEREMGIHTNLSAIEIYDIVKRISSHMDTDIMEVIDLSEEGAYRNGALESGYPVLLLNVNEFDNMLEDHFQVLRSRTVEKEQAKIEVFNSSSVGGLAGNIGRHVTNNGLSLLRAGNSPVGIDTTTIFVTNLEKYGHSVNMVKAYLERALYWSSLVEGESVNDIDVRVVTGRPSFLTTGDIVVVIGNNR
jgi:hypothetical protein